MLLGLIVIALFRNTLFPPALEDEIAAYEVWQQTDALTLRAYRGLCGYSPG